MSGESGIEWLSGEPIKNVGKYKILMDLLRDNHYSTVVDLEEGAFEIKRYAIQFRDGRSSCAIIYLELDKRYELSKMEIKDTLAQRNTIQIFKSLGNFKFYMREIHVSTTRGKVYTATSPSRGILQSFQFDLKYPGRCNETSENLECDIDDQNY